MELIQTKDYLLFVDEEAEIISKKGLYIDAKDNIFTLVFYPEKVIGKIIAYYPLTKEAKELDLPVLPNPFEGIDTICDTWLRSKGLRSTTHADTAFIAGYKAAQSKGQYSLEDMIAFGKKCFYKGFDKSENDDSNCYTAWREENSSLVQSLSTQQLPKEFIPEYENGILCISKGTDNYCPVCERAVSYGGHNVRCYNHSILKTITNSEGKEELVGKYIY